jgi:hypothetical protein
VQSLHETSTVRPPSRAPAPPVSAMDPYDVDRPFQPGTGLVSTARFRTAWCAVGGERGGEVVPRWFGALAELGVERFQLFWAVPETADPAAALDRLRSVSVRWMAGLQALGVQAELSIKRGAPGPWLTGLASLEPDSLIVAGPPAARAVDSGTIAHLLEQPARPLLLLPDLVRPQDAALFDRAVVDGEPGLGADAEPWEGATAEWVELSRFAPEEAVRTALRVAEDVDASVLVLPRRSAALVPLAIRYGNFPVLVPPAS